MADVTEDVVRIVLMRLLLIPAAFLFPRRWGVATADAVSWLLMVLPRSGRTAYLEARHAFGLSRWESLRLARRRLATPMKDFVVLRRVLRGREDPTNWAIIEKNTDGINHLRATGESFIIATGHFGREAIFSIHSPTIAKGPRITVVAPIPSSPRTFTERRIRLQYGTMLAALSSAWGGTAELVSVSPEHLNPALPLLRKLKQRGSAVYIHVDAPWAWRGAERSVYQRPFAGMSVREFSIGAARLARLAQCSIITCVPFVENNGTIVLEWGKPVRVGNELETMSAVLDTLEIAVGNRPEQYVLPIGRERHWNSRLQRWEEVASRAVT